MSNPIAKITTFYPAIVKKYDTIGVVVEYYVLDARFDKMVRFRIRLKRYLSRYSKKYQRDYIAQQIADNINKKLSAGWSPLYESENTRLYTPISELIDKYIVAKRRDGVRERTLKSYISITSIFKRWCDSENLINNQSGTFNKLDAVKFMDSVLERGGNRNYDNILKGTKSLFEWAKSNCYCKENPFATIKILPKEKKKRILIDHDVRSKIAKYFDGNKPQMSIVAKLVYYSAMRPNEISNIKIKDIHIKDRCIYISEDSSKNGKARCATITRDLISLLIPVINGKDGQMYLFGSGRDIMPGYKKVSCSYFRKSWQVMREQLHLPQEMQLYSLRDTGLSDFLHAGIDQLTVQHHADHSSIEIQNIYTDHYDVNLNEVIFEKAPEF